MPPNFLFQDQKIYFLSCWECYWPTVFISAVSWLKRAIFLNIMLPCSGLWCASTETACINKWLMTLIPSFRTPWGGGNWLWLDHSPVSSLLNFASSLSPQILTPRQLLYELPRGNVHFGVSFLGILTWSIIFHYFSLFVGVTGHTYKGLLELESPVFNISISLVVTSFNRGLKL